MAAPEKLAALRHLLAERFPSVPRTAGRVLPTGIPAIDDLAGGLPLSSVTELVCAAPSCGSQLFFGQLLAVARARRLRLALVDGTDSFDPGSYPSDLLAPLIWVRCQHTAQALQAADLLSRDANLGLVVLDLRHAPLAELRRTPATQWYRLQRAVEPTDLALLVPTPRALVASAHLRVALESSHEPDVFEQERQGLVTHLSPVVQRQRIQHAVAG